MEFYNLNKTAIREFIENNVTRINNCINGNPRYYISVMDCKDRPCGGKKYRGKKFGAGWVISTYTLEREVYQIMLNNGYNPITKGEKYYVN